MERVFNMKEVQWSLEWTDPQTIVASLQTYELCQKKYTNRVWGKKISTKKRVNCDYFAHF